MNAAATIKARGSRRAFNRRERVLIGVIVALLGGGALLRYVVLPSYRQWKDAREDVATRTAELTRLSRNLGMKTEVERLTKQLPADVWNDNVDAITLARFLTQIEKLAGDSNVTTTGIRPQQLTRDRGAATYRVHLSVVGRMPDLLAFMAKLTGGDTPTGVEALSLHSARGGEAVECSVWLKTVRLDRDKRQPPIAGGVSS